MKIIKEKQSNPKPSIELLKSLKEGEKIIQEVREGKRQGYKNVNEMMNAILNDQIIYFYNYLIMKDNLLFLYKYTINNELQHLRMFCDKIIARWHYAKY